MKYLLLVVIMIVFSSCKDEIIEKKIIKTEVGVQKIDTVFIAKNYDSIINSESYIIERLPNWLLEKEIIKELIISESYKLENRLNPLYLEEDFNGDLILDIAVPIFEISTGKKGFAIIHGKTFEIFIVGAGNLVQNGLSDNMDYIDIWTINREKINEPGIEEETGNGEDGKLILENKSIKIAKSELGGGQIYWNGKNYAYFHQTC